jgi:hypothetical protein
VDHVVRVERSKKVGHKIQRIGKKNAFLTTKFGVQYVSKLHIVPTADITGVEMFRAVLNSFNCMDEVQCVAMSLK